MDEKRKKKSGFLRALGLVLLLCAAVVAVALAVRSEKEGGLRSFWRSLRGETGTSEFFFENASGGDVEVLDLGLAVASNSGLYVYDEEGELAYSRLHTWHDPATSASGDYCAAWDVGGNLVLFFTPDAMITEVNADMPVISAGVNDLGYLTVCTEAEGYKGTVTVYNSLGTAIYRWSAGTDRILSARVSGRDKLLVLTLGDGGSRLAIMDLSGVELEAEYTYPGLIIDAGFTDAGITAVSTDSLIGLGMSLEERWRVEFDGRYLESFAIGRTGTVLALTDFQVGGGRSLRSFSPEGEELGSLELADEAVDIDVTRERKAVLSGGRVSVYSPELELVESWDCDFGAERVILRNDGTVLAAGTFSAYVYGADEE